MTDLKPSAIHLATASGCGSLLSALPYAAHAGYSAASRAARALDRINARRFEAPRYGGTR